ncbi:MAG: D-alanyl-D-alanine carboxypeptidase [Alphaproteobacteria bacterium]|nr:D-alanyl-D-alanine carboxypeptidase [Alphaproteobacteria bacterium]
MRSRISRVTTFLAPVLLGLAIWSSAAPASAITLDTDAREAILLDFDTGQILYEKSADELMPPASMSKIMTVYLAFERLKDGRLKMDDTVPVSEKAWKKGGSKMFIQVGTRVTISDLLRGIIVQSGNDAAIAMAEAIGGSEEAFAEMMTRKARELGMERSTFRNATGWPDPEHRMTARELAILATAMIRNFPEYYSIYSETEFTFNEIRQGNRNPLLYKNMGADGVKTGHTENAGYGLTASAVRDGRRLVLVINGLDSVNARSTESERFLDWGFREFDNYPLFETGEIVSDADVWIGDKQAVPLISKRDITLTLPRVARRDMTVTVEYEGPIPAPIEAGQQLAILRVSAPDMEDRTFPLYAGESVGKLGPLGRITSAIGYLVWGPSPGG